MFNIQLNYYSTRIRVIVYTLSLIFCNLNPVYSYIDMIVLFCISVSVTYYISFHPQLVGGDVKIYIIYNQTSCVT